MCNTACPGTSWDKSQDGNMWWRIKTGTPYTPPVAENVEAAGKDEAITTYQQLFEDVNVALKLPTGNKDIAIVRKKCAELLTIASNYGILQDDHKDFVKDVAEGIGCSEESEEAVRKALEASACLKYVDLDGWGHLKMAFKKFLGIKGGEK